MKIMINSRIVVTTALSALLAGGLLLAGCSEEAAEAPAAGTVSLNFSVDGIEEMQPVSRAMLATNTTVRVIAYKSGGSTPSKDAYVADQAYYWSGSSLLPCTVDENGMNPVFASQLMELPAGAYDFYAISPALPLNESKTTVSVDNGIDYATSVTASRTLDLQAPVVILRLAELQRRCVQVRFVVKKEDSALSSGKIVVHEIRVEGLADVQDEATVGGDLTPSSAGSQSLTLAAGDFSGDELGHRLETVFFGLPIAGAKLTLTLDLTLNGVRQTLSGGLNGLTLEKGKSYTLTTSIAYTHDSGFTIDAWAESDGNNPSFDHNLNYNKTYPYVINGNTIVMRDNMGGATDVPLHGAWLQTPAHAESAWDANDSGRNSVSEKFEVANADCGRLDWDRAVAACASYSQSSGVAGTWRLPTIRELNLILEMRQQLDATIPGDAHWSAAEYSSDSSNVWYVNFGYGDSNTSLKSTSNYVRCVRDL